ncbi:hypothetical protein [Burkholderia sp. PAMC 28687]|uniref:hypothetical protein n=1 Tax=Burkholderia sp. PAMC 28687 TaxID=1795874 RepID=UPI000B25E202|nr:hypothetical protein [Burkholderia sp. PAMC 28687]
MTRTADRTAYRMLKTAATKRLVQLIEEHSSQVPHSENELRIPNLAPSWPRTNEHFSRAFGVDNWSAYKNGHRSWSEASLRQRAHQAVELGLLSDMQRRDFEQGLDAALRGASQPPALSGLPAPVQDAMEATKVLTRSIQWLKENRLLNEYAWVLKPAIEAIDQVCDDQRADQERVKRRIRRALNGAVEPKTLKTILESISNTWYATDFDQSIPDDFDAYDSIDSLSPKSCTAKSATR